MDFWLGHAIGEMVEAYKSVQAPALRKMYLERERLISISAPKVDVAEVEAKLRVELNQRNQQLQTLVNGLTAENMGFRSQNKDIRDRLGRVETEVVKLKETIEKLLET